MFSKVENGTLSPGNWPLLGRQESDACGIGWDGWNDFEPGPIREEIWDVFDLDDETAEPQPEPGDFWGVVDPDDHA